MLELIAHTERRPEHEPPARMKPRCQGHEEMALEQAVTRGESVEEDRAGFHDAMQFGDRALEVLDVFEDLVAEDDVERRIFEGEAVGWFDPEETPARQHLRRELRVHRVGVDPALKVAAPAVEPPLARCLDQAPRSATQVEHPVRGVKEWGTVIRPRACATARRRTPSCSSPRQP